MIVLNTLNAAVSEHGTGFTSVSPNFATSESGIYAVGGGTDDGTQIDARVMLPITGMGSNLRKGLRDVFFELQGPSGSEGQLLVQVMTVDDRDQEVIEEFEYPVVVRSGHVSRGVPGRGIRANRIGLGYANRDGADFRLSGIEAEVPESTTRRMA